MLRKRWKLVFRSLVCCVALSSGVGCGGHSGGDQGAGGSADTGAGGSDVGSGGGVGVGSGATGSWSGAVSDEGAAVTSGTPGTGGTCPQSSWQVETCYTTEVAWMRADESGSAGAAGAAGAGGGECPPVNAALAGGIFDMSGRAATGGQCCYGHIQICG